MPESGYDDYDPRQPNAQRGDYLVGVAIGELEGLREKADLYDKALAEAQRRDAQAGTPLEDGEAGFQNERRGLAVGSPGDNVPPADPYVAAQEVFDRAMADGRQWKQAAGAAFNSLANAAHRGDRRVMINPRSVQAIGGGD
jgi:hypothetical protein